MVMARCMKIRTVLVTGGAGYLGSFVVRALIEAEMTPVVLDNLSTGHLQSLPAGVSVIKGDIVGKDVGERLSEVNAEAVVHLAARSVVSESVRMRRAYYETNALGTANLLRWMDARGIRLLVFSSSAGVYGNAGSDGKKLSEDTPLAPVSAYGETKVAAEMLIANWVNAGKRGAVIHRIFNLAGASADGEVGEDHHPETHLVPIAAGILLRKNESGERVKLFGGDYETRDGFPVRDYVHPEDAARAIVLSLQLMSQENGENLKIYNIGSGEGYTALEVVRLMGRLAGKEAAYERAPRREGDPAALIADISRAQRELNWTPTYSLEKILESALKWARNHPSGYPKTPDGSPAEEE
jgi:UDP-glucose 4-epimerase